MPDREKVIKYLPCLSTFGDFDLCKECPYNEHPGKVWKYGCAHGQDKIIKDALTLLKEQEPVEPDRTISDHGFHYDYCGYCGNYLPVFESAKTNYCSHCGRKAKWE